MIYHFRSEISTDHRRRFCELDGFLDFDPQPITNEHQKI